MPYSRYNNKATIIHQPIPKCKTPGCDNLLFDRPMLSYPKNVRYCEACRIENKKKYNAQYMKQLRQNARKSKDLLVTELQLKEQKIQALEQQINHLLDINDQLEQYVISLREQIEN